MSFRYSQFYKYILFAGLVAAVMNACGEQAPPVASNGGSGGGGGNYNGMQAQTSTPTIADCSASTARIIQTVQGGGNAVKGCLEIDNSGYCSSPTNFLSLASQGWLYDSVSDTWSSNVATANSSYKPAFYRSHFKSTDSKVTRSNVTVQMSNPSGATNCNSGGSGGLTVTAAPPTIANCSSTSASLTVTVVGAGANGVGCVDYSASAVPTTNCGAAATLPKLADVSDWAYTPGTDTWTMTFQTRNHAWFVPGYYKFYFRSGDSTKTGTVNVSAATTGAGPGCAP